MSSSDFDADIFLQIGKLLHKQDIEDDQKKSLILEDTKSQLYNSIENIETNELGIQLIFKLLDLIENYKEE
jgi:hypothetical protein